MMTYRGPDRTPVAGTCMVCRAEPGAAWYIISEPLVSAERSLVCRDCERIFLGAFDVLRAKNRHLILHLGAVL